MPIVACISHALFQWSISLSHTPKMFEHATKKSPTDIHTMILREFVLMSGDSTNVIIITSVPTIDNEAVVVVKTLSRICLEISDWFGVVAVVNVVPAGNVASTPAMAFVYRLCVKQSSDFFWHVYVMHQGLRVLSILLSWNLPRVSCIT